MLHITYDINTTKIISRLEDLQKKRTQDILDTLDGTIGNPWQYICADVTIRDIKQEIARVKSVATPIGYYID